MGVGGLSLILPGFPSFSSEQFVSISFFAQSGSLESIKSPEFKQVAHISLKSRTYAFANLIIIKKHFVYDLEEFWFAFLPQKAAR